MLVNRVERHIMKKSNPYFKMLDKFCFLSKNLYNHANYIVRNTFVKENKWVHYGELDKILRQDIEYPDYKNMPTAQSAQQILRLLDKNWKSFFKSIKDWSKNKNKYLGRPKLPKYKKKNGRNILILTNQNCKLKEGYIKFPKSFQGFVIKTKVKENLNQVRIISHKSYLVIEVVYSIEIPIEKENNGRYISIDIGVDNLVTVANNMGKKPFIINGKGLKSMNQYYNKKTAHYRNIAKRINSLDFTKRLDRLTFKRNEKIRDYIHKTSRFLVDYAEYNNVSVIVIGHNKNWKQKSKMSKKVNQNFIGIPFNMLIEQIKYKAEEKGITVIETEESYTSGTSVLDGEIPEKKNYNKSRRIRRGLFKSNEGKLINADVNGAYQIMKKVFPNEFPIGYFNGIEGVALHPIKVDIS